MGSTACIIYITKENGKNVIYSANIGDTRAILFSEKNYKRLSYDHRATDPNESNRIIKNGGVVFAGRVYGSLMLSRAFGDWELKNYGNLSRGYRQGDGTEECNSPLWCTWCQRCHSHRNQAWPLDGYTH